MLYRLSPIPVTGHSYNNNNNNNNNDDNNNNNFNNDNIYFCSTNGAMQKQFDVVEKEINSNLLFKKLKLSYALKFTIITKLRILKN